MFDLKRPFLMATIVLTTVVVAVAAIYIVGILF